MLKNSCKKFLFVLFVSFFLLSLFSALKCNDTGLKQRIVHSLANKGIHPLIAVLIISTLPVFELRGGIPFGINFFKLHWYLVFPIAILGNMIPVAPILLFLGPLSKFLSRLKFFKKFFDWLFKHTRSKSKIVRRYKSIGLMLFVAIPLPITGAWTGSVAAFLFNVKFHNAIISILFGVCISAVIVTTLSLLGIWGAVIAGAVLLSLGVLFLLKSVR